MILKGYFTEKSLPSSGLLPFFRSSICELNYSCYEQPIEKNYDEKFFIKLTNFALNVTESLNKQEIFTSTQEIRHLLINLIEQRHLATKLTSNLP